MAFLANGGGKAVAGMHDCVVGEREELSDEGFHDFFHGAAPKVGTADAACEERVAREEDRHGDGNFASVRGKEETGAAWRVAGCMNHLSGQIAPLQRVAFAQELVNFGDGWRLDAEEAGLHLHRLIERNVIAVHQNRSARVVVEFFQPADVVNVCMSADDRFDGELMAAEQIHDAMNFVAGVEDDGFAGKRIADDGAVALQDADRNREMQQALAILRSVPRSVFRTMSVRHAVSIAFGFR